MSNDEVTQQHGEDIMMTDQEIKNRPWAALHSCADKLSAEQLDYCVHECPDTALLFCFEKLTPDQVEYCIFEDPWTAQLFCAKKLTQDQLDYCEELTKND